MTNVESGSLYPEWLSQGLLTGDLPWDTGQTAFLAAYPLHDSYWIGVWAEPGEMPIAVIHWDAFWSDGRIPHPSDHVSQWPILLIAFTGATQLLISSPRSEYPYRDIIGTSNRLLPILCPPPNARLCWTSQLDIRTWTMRNWSICLIRLSITRS